MRCAYYIMRKRCSILYNIKVMRNSIFILPMHLRRGASRVVYDLQNPEKKSNK